MASTKISELTAANTIAVADVLPFVSDPSGSPVTKKITANNLANSILTSVQVSVVPSSNVTLNLGSAAKNWNNVYVKSLYANGSVGSNGHVLASNGTASYWTSITPVLNTAYNYTWTNTHAFYGNVTFTGKVNSQSNQEVNFISNNIVQMQYNPNSQVSSDHTTDSTWIYAWPTAVGAEVYVGNTLKAGWYIDSTGKATLSANANTWYFDNKITFPDSTTQSTAVDKVAVPANSSSTGSAGQIAWDTNSIYVCVSTDTWKKVDLSSF